MSVRVAGEEVLNLAADDHDDGDESDDGDGDGDESDAAAPVVVPVRASATILACEDADRASPGSAFISLPGVPPGGGRRPGQAVQRLIAA